MEAAKEKKSSFAPAAGAGRWPLIIWAWPCEQPAVQNGEICMRNNNKADLSPSHTFYHARGS